MLTGYKFGREITWNPESLWTYADDGTPANFGDPITNVCPKCGLPPTEDGHDPCIANLPGVEYACCGHGIGDGYVKFTDGRVLRGVFDHLNPDMATLS